MNLTLRLACYELWVCTLSLSLSPTVYTLQDDETVLGIRNELNMFIFTTKAILRVVGALTRGQQNDAVHIGIGSRQCEAQTSHTLQSVLAAICAKEQERRTKGFPFYVRQ